MAAVDTAALAKLGLGLPEILLPKPGTNMTKWACIACDQYTSEPHYWDEIKNFVGDEPSTYKLILPEVFLDTPEEEGVIVSVGKNMAEYKENNVMVAGNPGYVVCDRKTNNVETRKGLVVSLDLEHYSYEKGSTTLMRATEGTILARLPPRVRVREGATIELPHIMVLIDDPEETVIEPLFKEDLKQVYDFDLPLGAGHLKGWAVDSPKAINQISSAIAKLADPGAYAKKYGIDVPAANDLLLYAMGDGNHSFATAKLHWEKTKAAAADVSAIMDTHPARYALVELVNIHDKGLEFEGIHRALFNVDADKLLESMKKWFADKGSNVVLTPAANCDEAVASAKASTPEAHKMGYLSPKGYGILTIEKPTKALETASLQEYLDVFLQENPESKIDYIHGISVTNDLGGKAGNMGFFCPDIDKSTFFRTIIKDGAYPRKTFSMGEADEKRFYVEARSIV